MLSCQSAGYEMTAFRGLNEISREHPVTSDLQSDWLGLNYLKGLYLLRRVEVKWMEVNTRILCKKRDSKALNCNYTGLRCIYSLLLLLSTKKIFKSVTLHPHHWEWTHPAYESRPAELVADAAVRPQGSPGFTQVKLKAVAILNITAQSRKA